MSDLSHYTALRRDLHAHPELGFDEARTSDVVAAELAACGIEVHRGVGEAHTAVVGVLRRGSSTRSVGLRADMDALPVPEHNRFAHASRHAGRMHACGHDGHTAMLLAAARLLADEGGFDGTVHLVFQPAEETGLGALRMIEGGLFQRFPMEAIFAAHNWPGLPVGSFAVSSGPMMASCNEFTIAVHGKGAHAAMPDQGIDAIQAALQIGIALQTVVSRNVRPIDPAVLSVTQVHAGDALNVLPDACTLRGTVRCFSTAVRDAMAARLRDLAHHTAAAFGARCEVEFKCNCPPTTNHPGETAFVQRVLAALAGADRVLPFQPTMSAEDFSFMLDVHPGCYFMIGNGEGAHRAVDHGPGPCMLHNPSYDFNDALIPIGAAAFSRIVREWLNAPPPVPAMVGQ